MRLLERDAYLVVLGEHLAAAGDRLVVVGGEARGSTAELTRSTSRVPLGPCPVPGTGHGPKRHCARAGV